jgi:RND family efflux transporter MFP subunit
MLDYASPNLDPSTGTRAARAVFENSGRALLPGYFVRVRVPLAEQPDMLLVPDRAIGADQSGRYVLVAGKDDVVEQRTVELGDLVNDLRVITKGVTAEDRVIISGMLAAVPGQKVTPEVKALAAATPTPAAPPAAAAAPAPAKAPAPTPAPGGVAP